MSNRSWNRGAPRNLIAKFYRAADGRQPVAEFIEGLRPEIQVIIDAQIARVNMLDEVHSQLAFPHSSQIRGSLRELRCHYGSTLYRILYVQSGHFVVLLHMIRKNSGQIPDADIRIAKQRPRSVRMLAAPPNAGRGNPSTETQLHDFLRASPLPIS